MVWKYKMNMKMIIRCYRSSVLLTVCWPKLPQCNFGKLEDTLAKLDCFYPV